MHTWRDRYLDGINNIYFPEGNKRIYLDCYFVNYPCFSSLVGDVVAIHTGIYYLGL